MMPISEIHEGDMFANPLWVNSNPMGNIYCVEAVNKEEKLVRVQCYAGSTMKPLMAPFWKKNTDRMFSEAWRYSREATMPKYTPEQIEQAKQEAQLLAWKFYAAKLEKAGDAMYCSSAVDFDKACVTWQVARKEKPGA